MDDRIYKLIGLLLAGAFAVAAALLPDAREMLFALAGGAAGLFGFQLPVRR